MTGLTLKEYLKASAKRALDGRAPKTLYAYSVDLDEKHGMFYTRAHFLTEPSEDDLEEISVAETRILADLPEFDFRSDYEVGPAEGIKALAGGCAYVKTGQ